MSVRARYAIVGAGPAGLSAARMLQDRGVPAVVFECSAEPGGKCVTTTLDGRGYELAAAFTISSYRRTHALLRRAGLPLTRVNIGGVYVTDGGSRLVHVAPALTGSSWYQTSTAIVHLLALLARHRLGAAGFDGLNPALAEPFTQWCEDRGLEWCARFCEPWLTAFGYGYVSQMPAAYALKYAALFRPVINDLLGGGFQELWRRVAGAMDVRTNTPVLRVERGEKIRVHTAGGSAVFDGLIVACPPDQALAFLDAAPEEVELFSRIRYHRYLCTLVDVAGPPMPRWGFFMDNLSPERAGHPMTWYRRWPAATGGLVAFYTMLDAPEDPQRVDANIDAALQPFGCGVRRVALRQVWDQHCPHVGAADFRAGWYDRVAALQGQRGTWYTGDALTVSVVEYAVRLSQHVVRQITQNRR